MASLNEVTLIGNLGKDPEIKSTPAGMQIAKFTLATTHGIKKGDIWENETEWHSITCFAKTAESASKLSKGCQVLVKGRIKTESWDGDDGAKKYKTGIIADRVLSLGKKESNTDQGASQSDDESTDSLPF